MEEAFSEGEMHVLLSLPRSQLFHKTHKTQKFPVWKTQSMFVSLFTLMAVQNTAEEFFRLNSVLPLFVLCSNTCNARRHR